MSNRRRPQTAVPKIVDNALVAHAGTPITRPNAAIRRRRDPNHQRPICRVGSFLLASRTCDLEQLSDVEAARHRCTDVYSGSAGPRGQMLLSSAPMCLICRDENAQMVLKVTRVTLLAVLAGRE